MKLRGIRRFFESFRNLIYSLRKKPPSPPPDEDDVTPGTPVSPRHESQTVQKEDLEAIEREPPLSSVLAKDRIKIKPKKNHPRPQEKSCDPCQADDKSDTASQDSTDILGADGDSKSEKEKIDKTNKIPMKPPMKSIKHSTSSKDDEMTESSQRLVPLSEGDTPDEIDEKPTLINASSNASLASSVSAKSSELFEKHRHPSSEKANSKCCSPSLEIQAVIEKIPSRADSSQSIPNSDDVTSQKHSSKASLEDSAASISSSNDAELFVKEKTASPTNSDISLNGRATTLKSPIPAVRNIKPKQVSLSSSESLKLSHVTDEPGSTSSTKNLKDSKSFLNSRGTVSRTHSSPDQLKRPSPLNSRNGNKNDLKLDEGNEDVNEEADNDMKDEVFQKESLSISISEVDEPSKQEKQDATPSGDFGVKLTDKSSSKLKSLLPTEEMVDSISKNHVQGNSDACPEDGDVKSPKSGDCLEKTQPTEIQVTPRSTSDKNDSESGSRTEKPPTPPPKPEKPKLPPAVPIKPKFNRH